MTKLRHKNPIAQFAFSVGGVPQFANSTSLFANSAAQLLKSAAQFANSDIDSLGLGLGLGS